MPTRMCLKSVHLFGAVCSEMIYGAAAMIEAELRVQDIQQIIFPHPTGLGNYQRYAVGTLNYGEC